MFTDNLLPRIVRLIATDCSFHRMRFPQQWQEADQLVKLTVLLHEGTSLVEATYRRAMRHITAGTTLCPRKQCD